MLEDKVIVVTGAARGIGKVTAIHLATSGAHVAVADVDTARVEQTAATITAAGGSSQAIRCDVSVEDDVARLFATLVASRGRVDAVVNNAASTDIVSRDRRVVEQTTADFDHFMRTNVYSVFWSFKYGIPAMQPGGGSFVTMSSIESITPRAGEPSYATSKGAVTALSRQVAVDYRDDGIRANVLVLGFVETNASKTLLADRRIGDVVRGTTGNRPVQALDVAKAVTFLVSDGATGFNGSTITLDRGMTVVGHVPADLGISP